MIFKNLLLSIIIFSYVYGTSAFGYLKETEMSFCMDDCAEYYIESDISSDFINVVLNENVNIDNYLNRFVEVEYTQEIECIECNAFIIDTISLSQDCQAPVNCFNDPCLNDEPCQFDVPYVCDSNYCGGCYADYYDFQGNLLDCQNNSNCYDLTGLDFGFCDMYLGVGFQNGTCQYMSGCGWDIDNVDYSGYFFYSLDECNDSCLNDQNVCNDILESYEMLHSEDYSICQYDSDCTAIWGDCDVGLGGCHYTINPNLYQFGEVDILVEQWINESCQQGICDCLPLPQAVCSEGFCESAYCFEDNPAGCFQTGCEEGYECEVLPEDCVSSSCFCDESFNIYGSWICTEDCGGGTCVLSSILGDFNEDEIVNILDVILLVNFILNPTLTIDGDLNQDGNINILDIIYLISIITD